MSEKTKIFRKLRSGSYIYLSELNTVIHSSDFDCSLGVITDEYRFRPSSKPMEQGLTTELLESISSMIKEKAGIGIKHILLVHLVKNKYQLYMVYNIKVLNYTLL
mgnify:CR=1 FL=1